MVRGRPKNTKSPGGGAADQGAITGYEAEMWADGGRIAVQDMAAFIERMPKAELHMHIEGVLEPELKFAMAARNGIELPYGSVDDPAASYDFNDLPTFLDARYEGDTVLITETDFYDLGMAYYETVARENLVYAEIFFDPQAHTTRGVEFSTVIEGLHRAQVDAEDRLGIESHLIMCFLRDLSAESARDALEQAAPYRDWIIGVGLDSDEHGNPPSKFADVFAAAAAEGYRLTMHCDVDQENAVTHIWQAIDDIGVERIDHGVNALDERALTQQMASRRIGQTICPISNRYVVQDSRSRDIKRMLDEGMLPTVNSDDPAYFRGYMNDNLAVAQRDGDLSADEVGQLMRNAFAMSWTTDARKQDYLAALDEYVAASTGVEPE